MKIWQVLSLSLLVLSLGCQRVNYEGYNEFRRSTDRFQVADQPVHRFEVDPYASQDPNPPISALTSFELPEEEYEITPLESPSSQPKKAEPFTFPRVRNSRAPDPAPIQAVPQTQLPKPVSNINLTKKDIQYLLKQLGHYQGKIDGVFGPQTKSAVKKFQKNQGLVVDGVVGKKTKAALMKKLREKYGN